MSTLKTNTIQHLTSGFNNVVQFVDGAGTQNGTLCRAWVNFDGTGTVAIRAQFNVSSITDNGTGNYTVNFSSALVDGNYSAVVAGGNNNATAVAEGSSTHTQTSASCGINMTNVSAVALVDRALICVAVFR
jgi:hypothetical protein